MTSLTITDPGDALYDGDAPHPVMDERFEWQIRHMPEWRKDVHRRHRRERQDLAARQHAEIRRVVHETHGNWPEYAGVPVPELLSDT